MNRALFLNRIDVLNRDYKMWLIINVKKEILAKLKKYLYNINSKLEICSTEIAVPVCAFIFSILDNTSIVTEF